MSRLITFIVMLMLTACAQKQAEKQKIDLNAEEQAIRAVSMKWLDLQKAGDAAGVAALFTDDGVMYSENQEPVVGKAAIEQAFVESRSKNPDLVLNWITDRVEIAASGDLAVEYGSWTATGQTPEGEMKDQGKYITVYRKVDGTWKVAADIGNSTKPKEVSE